MIIVEYPNGTEQQFATEKELACELGLHFNTVCGYVTGRSTPPFRIKVYKTYEKLHKYTVLNA